MEQSIISVNELTKIYSIYRTPVDRLKEALLKNSSKHYSSFYALNDISFCINKGETIGIIGKNGSGKSTLLKILSGVLQPSNGEIHVNGTVSAILELGAGFNLEYTGIENIFMNGTILGKSKSQISERLEDIIQFADIGEFIDRPVKQYSSGMFARLAFAVAINVDPEILIIDEALAVGDMKFQAKCFRKFEELKTKGVTILFVGHDVSSIRKFCDKAMWLHEGKLLRFGETLEVTAEYMEYMNSDNVVPLATETKEESSIIETIEMISEKGPINRWGSEPVLIKNVFLTNERGIKTNSIKYGETCRVSVIFESPKKKNDSFSVAISLKNTMGLDLIVFTTYDDPSIVIELNEHNELIFEFVNYLTEGDYVLVAALEDRSNFQPTYYDYIEGVLYIKSISNKQLFGIVHTPYRVIKRK